jgi:hypothetical protein
VPLNCVAEEGEPVVDTDGELAPVPFVAVAASVYDVWLTSPVTFTRTVVAPTGTFAETVTAVPDAGVAVTATDETAPPVGTAGSWTSTFSHSLPEPTREIVGLSGVPSSTGVTVTLAVAPLPLEPTALAVTVTDWPFVRP